MRILIAFPGHTTSTIDVARGYSHALRALGHTVADYNYHTRLAFFGDALRYWEGQTTGFEYKEADALVLASESLAIEAVDFVPDVVLIVCGLVLHKRAYDLLHRLSIPTALLLTESPYTDVHQAEIAKKGHIGLVMTNDLASVSFLRSETGLPVEYLPHSFDPIRHYPRRVQPYYQSDVYFFGTWWPERRAMFEALEATQNGHHFELGGIQPINNKNTPELTTNLELARHYSGAKIAINHHRTIKSSYEGEPITHIGQGDAYSLGPRAFEIAACGAFQLSDNTRPELRDVFGDTVPTYENGADLVDKVHYFLQHEHERQALADASRAQVQACSFENRAREILLPALERYL